MKIKIQSDNEEFSCVFFVLLQHFDEKMPTPPCDKLPMVEGGDSKRDLIIPMDDYTPPTFSKLP